MMAIAKGRGEHAALTHLPALARLLP